MSIPHGVQRVPLYGMSYFSLAIGKKAPGEIMEATQDIQRGEHHVVIDMPSRRDGGMISFGQGRGQMQRRSWTLEIVPQIEMVASTTWCRAIWILRF